MDTSTRLINSIPAGYETDDSWNQNSITHEPEHAHNHTHNIVSLLSLHTWTNCPNRGQGQPHRQNNNINVRSGNAPYPRPSQKVSLTDGAQGVNRLSVPEHIASGNASTRYRRLLHRRCASLDLETAFKQIKISQDIQPELCTECRTD